MATEINENEYAYLAEIIYNGGAKVRYWFLELSFEQHGTSKKISWQTLSDVANPIFMGIDDVIGIHQLSAKKIKDIKDATDTRLDWEK
jgi:hypothetical protein